MHYIKIFGESNYSELLILPSVEDLTYSIVNLTKEITYNKDYACIQDAIDDLSNLPEIGVIRDIAMEEIDFITLTKGSLTQSVENIDLTFRVKELEEKLEKITIQNDDNLQKLKVTHISLILFIISLLFLLF